MACHSLAITGYYIGREREILSAATSKAYIIIYYILRNMINLMLTKFYAYKLNQRDRWVLWMIRKDPTPHPHIHTTHTPTHTHSLVSTIPQTYPHMCTQIHFEIRMLSTSMQTRIRFLCIILSRILCRSLDDSLTLERSKTPIRFFDLSTSDLDYVLRW